MLTPDMINGAFEACGGFFIALSVIKLHKDKVVRGVSCVPVAFFSAWGFWNLYFYPALDQWFSFWGGCLLVIVNCTWLAQMYYYISRAVPPVVEVKSVFTYEEIPYHERTGPNDKYRLVKRYRHADK